MDEHDDQRPVTLGYQGHDLPRPIRWMWLLAFVAFLVYLLLL